MLTMAKLELVFKATANNQEWVYECPGYSVCKSLLNFGAIDGANKCKIKITAT